MSWLIVAVAGGARSTPSSHVHGHHLLLRPPRPLEPVLGRRPPQAQVLHPPQGRGHTRRVVAQQAAVELHVADAAAVLLDGAEEVGVLEAGGGGGWLEGGGGGGGGGGGEDRVAAVATATAQIRNCDGRRTTATATATGQTATGDGRRTTATATVTATATAKSNGRLRRSRSHGRDVPHSHPRHLVVPEVPLEVVDPVVREGCQWGWVGHLGRR